MIRKGRPKHPLSGEQEAIAREYRETDITRPAIAEKYGVSISTIAKWNRMYLDKLEEGEQANG